MILISNLPNCWLSLLIILLIHLLPQLIKADEAINILESPEFIVQARVRLVRQESNAVDEEAEITEYYSNRLQRSRIEILKLNSKELTSLTDTDEYVSYYYSSSPSNQELPLIRETDNKCFKVDKKQLYIDLFSLYNEDDFNSIRDSWLNPTNPEMKPHIIGVGRFLIDLQQGLGPSTREVVSSPVRNRKVVKYTYNLNKPKLRPADYLYVYYQQGQSDSKEADLKKDIPLRLCFALSDGTEIIIDYMIVTQYHDLEYLNNDGLNRFALPLNTECLKDLPTTDLTKSTHIESMSFLFQRIPGKRLKSARRWEFVAFDKLSQAMRVETIQEKKIDSASGMFIISIIDLKLKTRFMIKQFRRRNWPEIQRCIRSPYELDLVSDLPLPLDKLTLVGPAKVRGVECDAYVSSILPEILYPPIQYQVDGTHVSESQKLLNCNKESCLVIYYFSRSKVENGVHRQLLRIDVADQEGLIERLEMQQFAFELLDAPNGDSRNALFSVRDRCSSIDLPINLAIDMKPNLDPSITHYQADATMKHLMNPVITSRELRRALIFNSWISAAILYDFMLEKTNGFILKVRAKLADIDELPTFSVKFVGTGTPKQAKHESKAVDWSECFFTSASLKNNVNPTFSFCQNSCLLDWKDIDKSGSKKTESEDCRIYQVTMMDRNAIVHDESFWNKLAESIQNTKQTVHLNDCDGCASIVTFDIIRAYIESDYVEDAEQRQVKELSKALASVGLDPQQSAEILPPKLQQIDKDTLELEQSKMSLRICLYACMSSLACKSYSLCSYQDKLECLISSADIRDYKFLKLLFEAKKSQTRDGSIEIPWTWTDKLSANVQEGTPLSPKLSLRLNKRCHTYTKRALDVFTRAHTGHLMSAHSTGVDVTGVNSKERCAKRCLYRNMDFFKQVSVVTSALERNRKNAALDQIDLNQSAKKELDGLMRSWCGHFAYLSKKSLSVPMVEYLQAHSATNKTGYCLLSSSKDLIHNEDETNQALISMPLEMGDVRVQEFLYSNLFERIPGVTLEGSKSQNSEYNPKSSDNLKGLMHLKNWQTLEHKESEEDCAKACFLQTSGLKPWCRSFSVIRPSRSSKSLMCIYNTMTLADVLALGSEGKQLFRKISPDAAAFYNHYEPRKEFLFDDYALARAEVTMMNIVTSEQVKGFFKAVLVILVLILSLATGLFLAIKFSFFVKNKIALARHSDLIVMELPVDDE